MGSGPSREQYEEQKRLIDELQETVRKQQEYKKKMEKEEEEGIRTAAEEKRLQGIRESMERLRMQEVRRKEEAEKDRWQKEWQEKELYRVNEEAKLLQEMQRMREENRKIQAENDKILRIHEEYQLERAREAAEKLQDVKRMQEENRRIQIENDRIQREFREKELRREKELMEQVREAQKMQEENRRVQMENSRIQREFVEKELRRGEEAMEQVRESQRMQAEMRRIQEESQELHERWRREQEEKKMKDLAREIEEAATRRVEKESCLRLEAERYLKEGFPPVRYPTAEEIKAVRERLQYQEGDLHIAITGVSGSGKSSLVNAFRGLSNSNKNPNAAKTGTRETTRTIGRYCDPVRPWLIWYDIPGAGTLDVPDWQYFNDQGLFIFDVIIIAIDSRFTKIDVGLLFSCQRFGIPTFVIRSKANQHIENILSDEDSDDGMISIGELFNRACDKFVMDTSEDFESILKKAGLPLQRVYTVSKDTLRGFIKGSATPRHIIHEVELIRDILDVASRKRGENMPFASSSAPVSIGVGMKTSLFQPQEQPSPRCLASAPPTTGMETRPQEQPLPLCSASVSSAARMETNLTQPQEQPSPRYSALAPPAAGVETSLIQSQEQQLPRFPASVPSTAGMEASLTLAREQPSLRCSDSVPSAAGMETSLTQPQKQAPPRCASPEEDSSEETYQPQRSPPAVLEDGDGNESDTSASFELVGI